MPGDDDGTGSYMARFYREHHVRFILCADDGREIVEIPRDSVRAVADVCASFGRGFVKQTWTSKVACTDARPGRQNDQG